MSTDSSDREICRDFLRNACSRGSRCKYQHKLPAPVSKSGELEFCRDFQNGTCKRTTCKYIHASRAEEEQYHHSGAIPMQIQALGLPVVNPTTSFPLPTLPVESSPDIAEALSSVSAANSALAAEICRDFLRGSCSRGDRCKFRHINPADLASSFSALTQPPSPSQMVTDQMGQFFQPAGSIPLPPNLSSVAPFSLLPPGVQMPNPPFSANSLLPPGLQCPGLLPSLPLFPNIQPIGLPFPLAPYPDASSMMEKDMKEIDRSSSPSPVHSSESGFGTGHKADTAQVAPPDAGKSNSGGKRKRTNSGSVSISSPTMKNQRNASASSSATPPTSSSGRNGNATNRGSRVDTQTQTATPASPSTSELDRTPSPADASTSADKRHASNQTYTSGSKQNASSKPSPKKHTAGHDAKHNSASSNAARRGADKLPRTHSRTSDTSEGSSTPASTDLSEAATNHTADCHPSEATDNLDLRRRVDQLVRQCSELVAANELLHEQNAFLRASCERRREGERMDMMPCGTCVMAVTNPTVLDAVSTSIASSASVTVGIPLQMPLPVATLPSSAMLPMSLVSEALTNCMSPGIATVSAVASHPLILTSSPIIHTGGGATLQEAISVPMQVSVQAVQPMQTMQTMLPLHSFGSPQLPLQLPQKLAIATAASLPMMELKESMSERLSTCTSTGEAVNASRCSTPQQSCSVMVSSVALSSSLAASSIASTTASLTMAAIPATLPQIATMLPMPVVTSLPGISALPMHAMPTTVTLTLPLHAVPVSSMAGVLRAQSHAVIDVASAKH